MGGIHFVLEGKELCSSGYICCTSQQFENQQKINKTFTVAQEHQNVTP